jgi:methionyl-tRNA formyltransferase
MNILLAGQKWFGAEVFRALHALPGVNVSAVSAPPEDRLAGLAALAGVQVIRAGGLNAGAMPPGIDLIVAAHSHDFIGEKTRLRARWGGIGYHPSLLPLHRGRDAVRWAVRMRERVTGGSVYRLSNRMDGGEIIAQQHVFIRPDDTAEELWRRELAPLGVKMLAAAVAAFAAGGFQPGTVQDEGVATWEPSIDRPPAHRPDLLMLCGPVAPPPPAPAYQPTYGEILAGYYDETLKDVVAGERVRAAA